MMRRWRRAGSGFGGRSQGRAARLAGALAAGTLAAALILAAVAWARLRQGPVAIGGLTPHIEAAAGAALDGLSLTLDGAELTLGDALDPHPGVRLIRLRLRDAEGRIVFAAPQAQVSFRPLDLLIGRLRPTAITLTGPGARLTRDADGRFRLGVGVAAAAEAGAPGASDGAADVPAAAGADQEAAPEGVARVLDALAQGAPGPLEALEEITLTGARLVYDDFSSGRRWRAERADLRVTRADGALTAAASVTLPGGALGPTYLRAEGARTAEGGARMRLNFSGVATRDLVDQFPALEGLQALDAPMQGGASVEIDAGGRLRAFDGLLRAAAGVIRAQGAEIALEGGLLDFSLDPLTQRYDLRRVALRTDHGALSGRATIDVDADAAGAIGTVTAQLDLDALTLAPPGVFAAPADFDAASVTLRARMAPLRIEIAEAHLARGPLRLDARGAASLGADGWTAEVSAAGRAVGVEALAALWPLGAAPGARTWIADNMTAGVVDRVDAFARVTPQGEDFAVTFAFSDATAHYFRPLPPITAASGWGEVTSRSFALTLDAGEVRPPGGGVVDLAGSVFRLPDLNDPLSTSLVEAQGSGPAAAFLEVLDFPPLGFPGKLDLAPRGVGGAAAVRARLTLPLLKDLALEQIGVDVAATLTDLAMTAPGIGGALRAERLTLAASVDQLSAVGDVTLDGAPLRLDWTETFDPAPDMPQSRFIVAATLTQAQRAAFGVEAAPWLDGPVGARATIELMRGGETRFEADLDLTDAALSAAPLGWRKAAGAAARAQVAGRRNGALALSRLTLEAPGLSLAGAARLDPAGGLETLELSRLRLGDLADLQVSVARDGAGFAVAARGPLLDSRAFDGVEAGAGGGADEDGGPPVALTLAVERLRVLDQLTIADAEGLLRRRADGAVTAQLRGRAGGAVTLDYAADAGGERLRLSAGDAGGLLRAADLFRDGVGGALELDADILRDGGLSLRGEARLSGFVVSNDPALSQMLARADIDAARASGVRFDTIRAPFTLSGATITLDEAVAYGPTIGVSISGDYHLDADRLDMRGVFSPAFGINSAIGAVPIIGGLLTGGEGRGFIAFNFRLTGPSRDPDVSVNPLSVLTPGILRRLFDGGDGPTPERQKPMTR